MNIKELDIEQSDFGGNIHQLLSWYQTNKRNLPWRKTKDPYLIWISEIMAQQTRIAAVIPYYEQFTKQLPTISSLAQLENQKLLKLWEGLGYYSRAKNLQKAAIIIETQMGGVFPSSFDQILSLPGIGTYTAAAIGSICFDLPMPVVDGNVLRVLCRYFAYDEDISNGAVKNLFFEQLKKIIPLDQPGNFNQAIMELGALVCTPNGVPNCDSCPLSQGCLAHQLQIWDTLPVKSPKSPRRQEDYTVVMVIDGDRILLKKRKSSGLLADMYQYVMLPKILTQQQVVSQLEKMGIEVKSIWPLQTSKHIFTHVLWDMAGFAVKTNMKNKIKGHDFVFIDQLESGYPLPSAFKIYTNWLKEREHE